MIKIKIRRQENPAAKPRWEEFHIPDRPYLNIVICLREIQKNPVTADGRITTPVVWDCNCLEEVCGACTMIINGKVRQACSALINELGDMITLEPMKKFPLICDLVVDRTRLFESLKRIRAWIPFDGANGPGPKIAPEQQQKDYVLATCFSCGCCLEACPQVNPRSDFLGAMAISQARLFNDHPLGKVDANRRRRALITRGGIEDCGNAQNCAKACPKHVPLVDSIAEMNRQITKNVFQLLRD
jgi:succinate dehydrogenase / fumarate reductase iron-sulfur subunit